jgi:hypothetical protein
MGVMVRRIAAVAELDDRPEAAAVTRARAATGDGDHAWILEQWRSGDLLLARVAVVVDAEDARGIALQVRRCVDDVWLERDTVPGIEEQIAEIAPDALDDLARELHERGVEVDGHALRDGYLHVELGDRLRAAI